MEGGGGERDKQYYPPPPQNPNNVTLYAKMALAESTWSTARLSNPCVAQKTKTKIISFQNCSRYSWLQKPSSGYTVSTISTDLFHKPILNTSEDHPSSSTREDIYKQL